ncbi:glutathione S-transferase family protein [Ponticaulis sp.]|uniref:glutathione S-transferase family protein n=1 Tax=Ponticaulis sp. TaxID=2020902 RepID=UPI00260788FF|nr:glutathione S-transferase family protein [Ponticaulis sp.]MDF1680476.1 glutathione S-transferase family protein [Ponticaulis sp.]
MRKLFHWPLDPASRLVRLVLAEKQLEFTPVVSPPWKPAEEVIRLYANPIGPVLIDQGQHGRVVANHTHAIVEFLEEQYRDVKVLPMLAPDRAEARRLWRWIESRFESEINGSILAERIAQSVQRTSAPDSALLRRGAHALRGVMTYLNALCEQTSYLAGRQLTIADLSAAAHLSALDYFGDVPWDNAPDLREWYQRVKSRPCFRDVLKDYLTGTKPVPHYADLDF